MHPLDSYPTIQKGLGELRKEAECERLRRAARLRQLGRLSTLRRFVTWVGGRLARWSLKAEHVGTAEKTLNWVPTSPHH
jgi:hypothetical protein